MSSVPLPLFFLSSFLFLLQVAATKAYEAAMVMKKAAAQSKTETSHLFAKTPSEESVAKRIKKWAEKMKKLEVGVSH